MSEDDILLRARTSLTLACIELARCDTWSATAGVLADARAYGKLLLAREQPSGEGASLPLTNPERPGAPKGAPAAPLPAGSSAPEGASGLFSGAERPSRIVEKDDLTAAQRCSNCGEARKPLFCSAQCANEHASLY